MNNHAIRGTILALSLLTSGTPVPKAARQGVDRRVANLQGVSMGRSVPILASPRQSVRSLPLSFEPNQGQADPQVRFLARAGGFALLATATGAALCLSRNLLPAAPFPPFPRFGSQSQRALDNGGTVWLELRGANPSPSLTGLDPLPGRSNYFIGNDPAKWHTNIPQYSRLRYRDIYPGIDWEHYGDQGQLEHDFIVAPHADPANIRLAIRGTDSLRLDSDGDLLLGKSRGEIRLQKPVLYQYPNGRRRTVPGDYDLTSEGEVRFRVGPYNQDLALVIDPVVSWATYLGGPTQDTGYGIATDGLGNTFVTGATEIGGFPTSNPAQPNPGGSTDVFVSKLNRNGSALLYSTYLGGSGTDSGASLAVDASGCAYVVGSTASTNFPVRNAFQWSLGGGSDAFIVKLSSEGNVLLYSSYLGGSDGDGASGIGVDRRGRAWIAGPTTSPDLPTVRPLQASIGGSGPMRRDAFVALVAADGSDLLYSTYIGGSDLDYASSLAVDSAGCPYVTGFTSSTDFPVANAFRRSNAGAQDAFVTKLKDDGSALVYSTYLGAANGDWARAIAVDAAGNAYVAGETSSGSFPMVNPFQGWMRGAPDGFVAKLNPEGSSLVYSTFLGGLDSDYARAIAIDAEGNAFVAGETTSADFPGAGTVGNTGSAFIVQLGADGRSLASALFFPSATANGITVDRSGILYATGTVTTRDFAKGAVVQPVLRGLSDAFVAKVYPGASLSFAQFADGESWVSSLLLTNPSTVETASGTVNFFDDLGQPLSVSINGEKPASTRSFQIDPLGSTTLSTNGTGKLVPGSVQVSSNIRVSGVVRFSYPSLGIAGVGESKPCVRLIMPMVRDAALGLSTGVALRNDTPGSNASVALSLRGLDGHEVTDAVALTLPVNGHVAQFLEQLFPKIDTRAFKGTLVVTAYNPDLRISATAIQLGSSPGQLTTLPIVPINPAPTENDVIFAHFANGGAWKSSLFLTNPLGSALRGDLSFFDRDGNRLSLSVNGNPASDRVPLSIESLGGVFLSTDGAGDLVSGSARVSANAPIGGVLTFAFPALGIAGVGASSPVSAFITPVSRNAAKGLSTGIAVTSVSSATVLSLTLRNASGSPVPGGNTMIALKANGQIARFIEELFPGADTKDFTGTLTVNSQVGLIAGTAIELGSKPGEFTTMPVSPLN
jgi:hypothetical protein